MTVLYIRHKQKVCLFASLRVCFIHAAIMLLVTDVELFLLAVNIVLLFTVQLIRIRLYRLISSRGLYLERWLLVKMQF